jgi:hypothetical protein
LKRRLALTGAILLLGLGWADAQVIYGPRVYLPPGSVVGTAPGEGPVPAYQVMTIVRAAGLTPLGPPVRRGRVYVLVAADRRHDGIMRVVVDAWSGDILRVVAAEYPAQDPSLRPPRAVGGLAPGLPPGTRAELDAGPLPPPPRGLPQTRIESVPSSGLEAAVPPLPRPRPHVAAVETIPAAGAPAVAASPAPAPRTTGSIEAPVPLAPAAAASPPPASKPELTFAPVVPLD